MTGLGLRFLLLWPWLLLVGLFVGAATALAGRGTRQPWRLLVPLSAGGTAAAMTAAFSLLWRLLAWIGVVPSLAAWAGSSSDLDRLAHSACRFNLVAAAVFGGTLVLCALRRSRSIVLPSPLSLALAGLAALGALFAMGALALEPVALGPILDLVAVAPVVACGLIFSALAPADRPLSAAPEGATAEGAAPTLGPSPAADPESVLRRLGLLQAKDPDFQTEAQPLAGEVRPSPVFDRVWVAAGGRGPTPQAIFRICERLDAPVPSGVLVGDLPAETEAALVATVAVLTLTARAGRVLVLSAAPERISSRVLELLERLGVPSPGPAVAHLGVLKETLARGELPALVCLGLGELSSQAIALLGSGPTPWLAAFDLLLLERVDGLLPVEATHLAFTLRRLGLALIEHRSTPVVAAVGEGTLGAQRLFELALARSFERLPLESRATAPARVFIRRTAQSSALEIAQWSRALAAPGISVQLEDAVGELSDVAASAERLHHHPGYRGRCALSLLDERHLASLFRMRVNLAHRIAGDAHLGCWWVKDSPLVRFLTQRGTLAGLSQQEELPSPRPVVGLGNRFLAAAHLLAALHEGKPDEAGLRQAFGEEAVTQLLAAQQNLRIEGTRARFDARTRTIVRSRILTRAATAWPDERRETVTQNVVEVRSEHDGAVLRHVDRRVAATRFYPARVFQSAGKLYEVSGAPLASAAGHILVSPAAPQAVPTLPVLSFELSHRHYLGEVARHHAGKLVFARAVAALSVREAVTGALPRGSQTPNVRYPAVGSEYDTVAAVIAFEHIPSSAALVHVARLIDSILPAHLLAESDDIEVLARPEGLGELRRPALIFVDRNLDGIGVAEALDAPTVHDLLRWAWGVLYSCRCLAGCPECTPPEILRAGPDKPGALKLLGG